jgi:hypothetical protein
LGDEPPQPTEIINMNKHAKIMETRCRENITLPLNPDPVVSEKGFQIDNFS